MSPSFGHSCAGRAGAAALLVLLLTTLSLPTGLEAAFGAPASPPLPLSLGFGPSSLSPVSDGVPIYTVGDTIWASSGFDHSVTVSLTSAKAATSAPPHLVSMRLLDPQVVVPLHTFTPSDTDGVWNLTISAPTSVVQVRFVNPAEHPVSLGPALYSLDGGNITISAQANLGDSYDQEVCAGGDAAGAGVTLGLPAGMHDTGSVTLIPGSPFTVVTSGRVNESSSFWFELYHPYALDVASANSVVVTDLMSASSRPVALASNATSATTLTRYLPLREGRYDLRAYFQNSTNIVVVQSRVLVVNDSSWVSLSDQCRPLAVQSQSISYSASLTNDEDNWPRNIYVMYRTFGVESLVSYHVDANISSVNFVASPWNQPLQGLKVNVLPTPGIIQTSQYGSSIFVLASAYLVQLNYSLDIDGGHDLARGSLTVDARYTSQRTELDMAKLTVSVSSDQSAPTSVVVTGPRGLKVTSPPVGTNQTSSFILPTGSYTVTASQGDNSQSAEVGLTDGVATSMSLNLSTFPTLEIILAVTAIIAAVANGLVWAFRSRGLRSRLGAK